MPPQPSPCKPHVKPCCTQLFGVQPPPHWPGVPPPPQVWPDGHDPQPPGAQPPPHTPAAPPPPQLWPAGQAPQLSLPPQPSPCSPHVKPCCAHVFGTQPPPHMPGVPPPPQLWPAAQVPQSCVPPQ